MKTFSHIAAALLLGLGVSAAHATVFVPGGGNSGLQSFSYMLGDDCIECSITLGVSNAGDSAVSPNQQNTVFGGLLTGTADLFLDGSVGEDTSAYLNFFGENGTAGDIETIGFSGIAGESLSFDWQYQSTDGGSFHDFSFVQINDAAGAALYYEVLAQDVDDMPVSEPGLLVLFGLGLTLMGLRRRRA